jgi:hypothetical protein
MGFAGEKPGDEVLEETRAVLIWMEAAMVVECQRIRLYFCMGQSHTVWIRKTE